MYAYLGQGKLHVCEGGSCGGNSSRTIDSAFGKSLRDRALQIEQRHSWKMQGRGSQFMGGGLMFGASPGRDAAEFPITMTGISRGSAPGELLYTLETNEVAGVFAVDAEGVERRIFHTADFRVRGAALSPDGKLIAASMLHRNGTANLMLLGVEGNSFDEVTEGDSVDLAPRWVPGRERTLVFQSAGLGRDAGGRLSGLGPASIEELDCVTGAMATLASDPRHDLVNPRMDAAGNLYYIRRPFRKPGEAGASAGPLTALKDAALFPFRIGQAIFQFLNFFSMRYSGKSLTSAQGGAARPADLERMMMLGNLLQATQGGGYADPRQATPESLVPSAWQLVVRRAEKHRQQGEEELVLAKGVVSFDLAGGEDGGEGAVIYSTGTAIHRIATGGRGAPERLTAGEMIGQVVAL